MQEIWIGTIQPLTNLFSKENWCITTFSLPLPKTVSAWLMLLAAIAFFVVIVLAWKLWSRYKSFGKGMTIEIIEDTGKSSQAEIKRKDAKQHFKTISHLHSSQEGSVTLLLRIAGKTYSDRCLLRVNQGTGIEEGHLKIETTLARELNLPSTDVNATFPALVDVRPPSWWASTFGNPDPSISSQWVVGGVLGVTFLVVQTVFDFFINR